MGCGSSSGASDPERFNDDEEFGNEMRSRAKFDKSTGGTRMLDDGIDDVERPEDDFFAV